MPLAPDVPYEIGDAAFGGFVAGLIDTTRPGSIIAADASQVGQRYVLIVSPKTLETASRQYKTTNTAGPAATRTRWNGLGATQAMNSAEYPAAQYCLGLTRPADKASAWYLPAMDELELIYRNLKATTESNNTSSRMAGDFPGTSVPMGENISSDPTGTAYSSSVPGQTPVTAFRAGGAQALGRQGQNDYYWTATEYSAASAWIQGASGSVAGNQGGFGKDGSLRVRPVRRILVSDLNSPPNAPIVSDQGPFDRAVTNRVDWQFSDPDPGDTQSAAELRYRVADTANWLTTVSIPNPNQFWDSPPGTWVEPRYEAQVRTRDQQGEWGPWSQSFFITAGDAPPGATILSPTSGATIPTDSVTVTISAPDVDEAEYRLYADDNGVMGTTQLQPAQVKTSGDRRTATWAGLANDTSVWLWVRVKHAGLWQSQPTTQRNPVSFTPPPAPSFTVTFVPEDGALDVHITNPASTGDQPPTAYNTVEVNDDGGWETKHGSRFVPPNSTWRYWLPRSLVDYAQRVRVTAHGDNGTSSTTTGVG